MFDKRLLQAIFRVGKYIATFLAFYFFAMPIHEWGHLQMCMWLGGEGYITRKATLFGDINGMFFTTLPTIPNPETAMLLVSFAGGLSVVILFSLVFIFDYRSGDIIGAMAILPTLTKQLIYGIVEGACYNMSIWQFYNIGTIATTLGFSIGLVISIWIVINYIADDLYRGEKKVILI